MVSTAMRNVYEFDFKVNGELFTEIITFEMISKFIEDNFCEGERDIFMAYLSAMELKVKAFPCTGDIIDSGDIREDGKIFICTKCANRYDKKLTHCPYEELKRTQPKNGIIQSKKPKFKCEGCGLSGVEKCPHDGKKCINTQTNKASKFGNNCNTIEEYEVYLKNVQKE
jgi:hypothetical protein